MEKITLEVIGRTAENTAQVVPLADVNSPILVIDHGEYPPYKSAQMWGFLLG